MTRALILTLVAMTALAGCGKGQGNFFGNRLQFDGEYFRARVDADRENREFFSVSVNDAYKTLTGAREAARHRANEYCIRQFGLSDITWEVSPDVEDDALPIVDGTLILRGECEGWR